MKTAETDRRQWLRQLARETDRARLGRARQAVADARAARRTAKARARATCQRARAAYGGWVKRQRQALKAAIARLRAKLASTIDQRRAAVRRCCGPDKERARTEGDASIAQARAELAELLEQRRRERTWTRRDSLRPAPVKVRERRQESDSSVEAELDADELTVWRKVKRQIAGTARMSRTEAFRHWLHDNSADVARILAADADAAYERALRDEERERARMHRPRGDRELARYVAAELEDVPFEVPPCPPMPNENRR